MKRQYHEQTYSQAVPITQPPLLRLSKAVADLDVQTWLLPGCEIVSGESTGFERVHILKKARMFFISPSGSHCQAPSTLMRSKFHSKRPRIRRISMYDRLREHQQRILQNSQTFKVAYCFPIQPLGPSENGCAPFLTSVEYASSSHRSGMNESQSRKLAGLCDAA